MAAPAFVGAGAGVTIASGSAACTVAGTTAGNLIILQVLQDGTAAARSPVSAITRIENLAGHRNALTVLATASRSAPYRADSICGSAGRSSGTVSVTVATTGDDLYYRLYVFTDVDTGTTLAAILENGIAERSSAPAPPSSRHRGHHPRRRPARAPVRRRQRRQSRSARSPA